MMKAAIYYGKNDIRVEERPIPTVGSKDVLVRNLRGGICGTDINIVKAGAGNMGIIKVQSLDMKWSGKSPR